MDTKNIEDIYKLSPVQQALLFLAQQAPDSVVSFEQSARRLTDLDAPNYIRAWQAVVDRHAILRTAFFWEDLDEPLQVVSRHVELPVEQLDWRELEPPEQKKRLAAFLEADRRRGIDMSQPPLMRLILIRLSEDVHQMIWSYHHILLDGWSVVVVVGEVQAYYTAFQEGRTPDLPKPRPFRDYIAWLRRQNWQSAETFWRQKLHGVTGSTVLPIDRAAGGMPDPLAALGKQEVDLLPEESEALLAFARQHRSTVNTLLQAAWAMLLSRYSGEADVVFGLVVHGRPTELSGFESMVGLFINGLPVRIHVPATGSILDWLKTLHTELAELRRYGYTPLTQIQNWLGIRRNKPMFDYLLIDQSYRSPTATAGQGGRQYELFEVTGYPLTLYLKEGDGMVLQIAYDRQRFDEATIARLLRHLHTLLSGMLADPNQSLSDWSMLTPEEAQQVLHIWNDTAAPYPPVTLPRLFAAQAAQTPHAPAVVWQGGRLTYAELDSRSNQLAHYLQARGVGPEVRVGLCVRRSPEMIIGLLGILKAGGAYVPLDPAYPASRLTFMMQDAHIRLLLTQSELLPGLPPPEVPVTCLDSDWADIARGGDAPPATTAQPDNLAYVIYTSGSTGQPKGVMTPHRALVQYATAAIGHFAIAPGDRVLQFASISFDAAGEEIYPCLLRGATLVLRGDGLPESVDAFLSWCAAEAISVLDLPTAYWHSIVAELETNPIAFPPTLRLIILGGEAASPRRLVTWRAEAPVDIRLVNTYGPTETTIVSTRCDLTGAAAPESAGQAPIGRPIANARAYVLDAFGRPLPVGVPGELYLGGEGVARGYLNRPDLTAERFVPAPLMPPPSKTGGDVGRGQRLYRTGDRARWLEDGNLEFLGRVDHQVKVRGFRIELGEVEAALAGHPAVQAAAAAVHEDANGNHRLVAYIVAEEGQADDLRDFVRERLPEYMIPAMVIPLAALPLTPSGKLDRRALPAPDSALSRRASEFVPPETPLEEDLCKIWAGVLDVERVGILDNFFDLGGDSLSATQVVNQVNRKLQVSLSVRGLIERPTIAELALLIEETLIEEMEMAA